MSEFVKKVRLKLKITFTQYKNKVKTSFDDLWKKTKINQANKILKN